MADGRRDPARVVALLDGRASWKQLSLYCSEHAVRRALDQGRLVRSGRGRYVLPDLPDAWGAAARAGGVLSHLSAAVDLGLPVLVRPSQVDVTLGRTATRRKEPGVVLHHVALAPEDLRSRTTSALRTVLDCAATLPFREGLAVADSALRLGCVRSEDLLVLATRRGGVAAARIRRVAADADGDAANPFESALRAEVLDAGLAGFVPQQPIRLANGATVHVDLGDPRRHVALEADSFEHHGTRRALRDDCRRYDELVRVGWTVLRFAWEHVVLNPAWVRAVVRDVVEGSWVEAA
jgi:very-short-patch-repair endonuclease